MARTRLYKAIKLATKVCTNLEIPWVNFTRQQLRPTAITQTHKAHGQAEARKLVGLLDFKSEHPIRDKDGELIY